MIDLAKKAEDAKDFDKSILYLAKAIELDRPPMQNLSRKKWRSKEGKNNANVTKRSETRQEKMQGLSGCCSC